MEVMVCQELRERLVAEIEGSWLADLFASTICGTWQGE